MPLLAHLQLMARRFPTATQGQLLLKVRIFHPKISTTPPHTRNKARHIRNKTSHMVVHQEDNPADTMEAVLHHSSKATHNREDTTNKVRPWVTSSKVHRWVINKDSRCMAGRRASMLIRDEAVEGKDV